MKSDFLRIFAIFSVTALPNCFATAQQPLQTPDSDSCNIPIHSGRDVDRKLKILAKPEPEYSQNDRRKHVSGVIVLEAVFCGSGKVTNIKVKHGLSDSLNEKAIEAAKKIQFIPAEKDGQKVSQRLLVQYLVNT
jgi:TonB family protein